MPNFGTHKKIGFIVGIIIGIVTIVLLRGQIKVSQMLTAIPIIFFYSNLPDLDHHMAKIRKLMFGIIFTIMAASLFLSIFIDKIYILLLISASGTGGLALLKVKHRGPLHSHWFGIFTSLPVLFLGVQTFVMAYATITSHIVIDRITSKVKRVHKAYLQQEVGMP